MFYKEIMLSFLFFHRVNVLFMPGDYKCRVFMRNYENCDRMICKDDANQNWDRLIQESDYFNWITLIAQSTLVLVLHWYLSLLLARVLVKLWLFEDSQLDLSLTSGRLSFS